MHELLGVADCHRLRLLFFAYVQPLLDLSCSYWPVALRCNRLSFNEPEDWLNVTSDGPSTLNRVLLPNHHHRVVANGGPAELTPKLVCLTTHNAGHPLAVTHRPVKETVLTRLVRVVCIDYPLPRIAPIRLTRLG